MCIVRNAFSVAVVTLLIGTSLASAQDTKAARPIEADLEGALAPLSQAIGYGLRTALPAQDGRDFPLGLTIEPTKPDDPVAIVFTCIWGPQICEPFFVACDRLLLECSDGGLPNGP